MSDQKPTHAAVRRGQLRRKTVVQCLPAVEAICNAGAQSPEVQASPAAVASLDVLLEAYLATKTSLANRQALAIALAAAIKTLARDFATLKTALGAYEGVVGALAGGNAAVITKAGLPSRDQVSPAAALGKVSAVYCKPGKNQREAVLTWSAAPGATSYAIEVNLTPDNPSAPWQALNSGSKRRRVIKGPTPGCQILARVAALDSDGTMSDWSDAVLATAR